MIEIQGENKHVKRRIGDKETREEIKVLSLIIYLFLTKDYLEKNNRRQYKETFSRLSLKNHRRMIQSNCIYI